MHLFDEGWEKLRETIFANQKRLGIMPPNAQLTPWPDGQAYNGAKLPRWDSLSWEEKKLFIKQADVYGPIRPTPTTRSAASSRPSRTWASSTTR
jgi:hypothetical protein